MQVCSLKLQRYKQQACVLSALKTVAGSGGRWCDGKAMNQSGSAHNRLSDLCGVLQRVESSNAVLVIVN